jgi:hypothetical protein
MNTHDPRSSLSSYGDPRSLPSASFEPSKPPPAKILLDGYRDALDPQNEQNSRFNPVRMLPVFVSPHADCLPYSSTRPILGAPPCWMPATPSSCTC